MDGWRVWQIRPLPPACTVLRQTPNHQPHTHTGNGTEEILTSHRATSFQFISLHAANLFPYTGGVPDPSRYPHLVNIPIEAPLTPAKYRKAWAQVG